MKKIEQLERPCNDLASIISKLNEVIAAVNDLMPQSVPVNKSSSAVWADAFDLPREPDARYTKQERLEQLDIVIEGAKEYRKFTPLGIEIYEQELAKLKEML